MIFFIQQQKKIIQLYKLSAVYSVLDLFASGLESLLEDFFAETSGFSSDEGENALL